MSYPNENARITNTFYTTYLDDQTGVRAYTHTVSMPFMDTSLAFQKFISHDSCQAKSNFILTETITGVFQHDDTGVRSRELTSKKASVAPWVYLYPNQEEFNRVVQFVHRQASESEVQPAPRTQVFFPHTILS